MLRAATILLVLAIPLSAAWADDSADAHRLDMHKLYTGRLLSMGDTAADHVEMAKWCASVNMTDRAEIHWKEALARDEGNSDARAALGLPVRNDNTLRPGHIQFSVAPSAPKSSGAAAELDGPVEEAGFLTRRAEFRRLVTEIARDQLPSTDFATKEAGRRTIAAMTDPAAVEPIATILANGNPDARMLAVETLGRIPGDESSRHLARYSLKDACDEVRAAAATALKDRQERRPVPQLVAALKSGGPTRDRAAMALAEMGDRRAIPALINRLNRTEQRILEAPVATSTPVLGTGVYIAIGTVTTYVADLQPIVSTDSVGWDPTIGAITTGGVLDVRNVCVTIYRTIYNVNVPRPAVHDALTRLTGEDFGYDTAQWQAWYGKSAGDGRAGR